MLDNMLNFMKLISAIFNPNIMYPILFVSGAALFIFKKKTWDVLLISSGLITMSVVYTLKIAINKPRPDHMLIIESAGKAFPSGHSALAAVFTTLIIYATHLHFRKVKYRKAFLRKYKYFIYISILALFLLVPISRLYLHVHDIYDVIAGYSIGGIVTLFCIKCSHRFFKRNTY